METKIHQGMETAQHGQAHRKAKTQHTQRTAFICYARKYTPAGTAGYVQRTSNAGNYSQLPQMREEDETAQWVTR